MSETIKQNHPLDSFLYSTSRMFERASYYGIRAILIIYLIEGSLKMEETEAVNLYAMFSFAYIISKILGAIIGDLLLGNKQSMVLGLILQTVGAFSLCFTSIIGVYPGLCLVTLGGGLYAPNIMSNFGKMYLHKLKLLDAGYMMFYLAVNLGSFLGVLLIVALNDEYGFSTSFICSGILMILSIAPLLFLKGQKPTTHLIHTKLNTNKRITIIGLAFLFIGVFWLFYNISYFGYHHIEVNFRINTSIGISPSSWSSIDSFSYIPVILFAVVIWTYFYTSQIIKLLIACVFGATSFTTLLLIPETPEKEHLAYFFISMILLRISEAHISPITHSILAKYCNPKYLAILISLVFIPTQIFYFISIFLNTYIYESTIYLVIIGVSGMIILSVILIRYNRINNKLF